MCVHIYCNNLDTGQPSKFVRLLYRFAFTIQAQLQNTGFFWRSGSFAMGTQLLVHTFLERARMGFVLLSCRRHPSAAVLGMRWRRCNYVWRSRITNMLQVSSGSACGTTFYFSSERFKESFTNMYLVVSYNCMIFDRICIDNTR